MSGLVGRGQISFRKKIVAESLIPALGIKKVRLAGINAAAIAPVSGIITLPFANFVPPPEMVAEGFSNPSSTEIVNLRLGQFRNNVQVSSNLNGVLLDQIAYTITDESLILQDSYMVTAGEIFVLTIDSNPVTCQRVVDARPLRASGGRDGENLFANISAAPVDFSVGQGYRIAPSAVNSAGEDRQQIGNVQVFVNGVLQIRNDNNSVAQTLLPAAMQSGNYAEVALTSAGVIIPGVDYANAIRFNQFNNYNTDDGVLIVATNVIVDEPNGTGVLSLLDNIEMGVATNTTELATIPTVPANLTDETDYVLQLPANSGAAVWATSGGGGSGVIQVDTYETASGTFSYIVPVGTTALRVTASGGGAPGNGASAIASDTNGAGGAGGNAGQYDVRYITIGTLAANRELSVVIGGPDDDTSISGTGITTSTFTAGGGEGGSGGGTTIRGTVGNPVDYRINSRDGSSAGAGSGRAGGGGSGGNNPRAIGGSGGNALSGFSSSAGPGGGGGGAGWVNGDDGSSTTGNSTGGPGGRGGMVIEALGITVNVN